MLNLAFESEHTRFVHNLSCHWTYITYQVHMYNWLNDSSTQYLANFPHCMPREYKSGYPADAPDQQYGQPRYPAQGQPPAQGQTLQGQQQKGHITNKNTSCQIRLKNKGMGGGLVGGKGGDYPISSKSLNDKRWSKCMLIHTTFDRKKSAVLLTGPLHGMTQCLAVFFRREIGGRTYRGTEQFRTAIQLNTLKLIAHSSHTLHENTIAKCPWNTTSDRMSFLTQNCQGD